MQTLAVRAWGALSVPRKKQASPLVAASATACRCRSLFSTGRHQTCGLSPPCNPHKPGVVRRSLKA